MRHAIPNSSQPHHADGTNLGAVTTIPVVLPNGSQGKDVSHVQAGGPVFPMANMTARRSYYFPEHGTLAITMIWDGSKQ